MTRARLHARQPRALRGGAVAAAVLALCAGAPASAQEAVVEGAGYEIGEGTVLHPRVGLDTGVISNLFYEQANVTTAPLLRVGGMLSIASQHNQPRGLVKPLVPPDGLGDDMMPGDTEDDPRAQPTWDFRASGYLNYTQFVHTDIEVTEQSSLTGGFQGHATYMPHGMYSLIVDELMARDARPRNFESMGHLNRWINQLKLGGRARPGNGALELSLRYENLFDYFESAQSAFANRMNHLVRGRAEWQFLPITRFFFDASYGLFGPIGGGIKPGSTPLRVQLGAASAITEMTTIRAHAGYAKGFYEAGPDFSMAIFGAEVGLRYSPIGRATLAYEYDFEDSINANYYRDHAILARVDQQLSMFILDLRAELRLRGYRGVLPNIGPPIRDDLIIGARTRAHYLYRDWLAFVGELELTSVTTGYVDALGDDPSFTRFEVLLGTVAAF